MKNGSQSGARMGSKVDQKINAIFDSKNKGFLSEHCPKTEPKWRPKSRKFVDISGYPPKTPPRRPNGGQGAPKWSQNGAKIEPKGSQMERKWSSKRAKIENISMRNKAVECDGDLFLGMASTRFLMDVHWISNGLY